MLTTQKMQNGVIEGDLFKSGIGLGMLGEGDGDGTGEGAGVGASEGIAAKAAKAAKEKQNETLNISSNALINDNTTESVGVGQRTEFIDPVTDLQDASAYVQAIAQEPEINHIFKNSFYRADPLPQWSFSVDFIPNEITLMNYDAEFFKTLTKAIISTKVNDYKVNVGSINYAGLQHTFATNTDTAGDLQITFAENSNFTILSILNDIYKYTTNNQAFAIYDITPATSATAGVAAEEINGPAYKLATASDRFRYICDIVVKIFKPGNAHAFGNELENMPSYVITYKHCWLKKIGTIDLNYNSDEPIDIDAVFTYQYAIPELYEYYLLRTTGNTTGNEDQNNDETADKSAWEKFKDFISLDADKTTLSAPSKSAGEIAAGFGSPFASIGKSVKEVFWSSDKQISRLDY